MSVDMSVGITGIIYIPTQSCICFLMLDTRTYSYYISASLDVAFSFAGQSNGIATCALGVESAIVSPRAAH